MIRVFTACILALFVTFGLFFTMSEIVFKNSDVDVNKTNLNYVDFVRLKPKPKEIKKQNKKKHVQQKQKTLPKRVTVATQRQKLTTKMPKINLHPIDIPHNFKSTVTLNDINVKQEPVSKPASQKAPQSLGYSTDIVPLFTTPPLYPRRAKRRNIQGYVVLNFTIDKKGNVKNIIVKSSRPKGYFEKAAKDAIRKWRFKPKYDGENAIEQLAQQKLEFTLR